MANTFHRLVSLVAVAASTSASAAQAAPDAAPPASPVAATPANQATGDLDALRREYLALRAQVFSAQARQAAVAGALFSARLRTRMHFGAGRFFLVTRATIRLDGATIYDDAAGKVADDDAVRFDGYVSPGRHVLTFRVETLAKDDDRFGSTQDSQVVVDVATSKDTYVTASVTDDGDLAYAWKRKARGSYALATHVDVEAVERGGKEPGRGR